jgi:uncharacterized protein (UPF0335 family)
MENRIDHLARLAHLAKSAAIRDRQQIERINRVTKEAADTAQKTAEVIKRIMSGQKPTS